MRIEVGMSEMIEASKEGGGGGVGKNSKKLQFYNLFKHDYKISSHLDLIRNSANRKDLVKISYK